jgi:hypothetical protein
VTTRLFAVADADQEPMYEHNSDNCRRISAILILVMSEVTKLSNREMAVPLVGDPISDLRFLSPIESSDFAMTRFGPRKNACFRCCGELKTRYP